MKLTCTNPNYINVDRSWTQSKTKKARPKPRITFLSRNQYLQDFSTTPLSKNYKTRCGKCLACKLHQGYQWSNRLLAESYNTDTTYYITFTFSDDYYDLNIINDTPLRFIQLFMKRLRKKFKGLNLRYYTVGELGGETLRFHYHMILFAPTKLFPDMRPFKRFKGKMYYRSAILESIWQYGGALFNYAVPQTISYVANYINTDNGHVITHSYSRGLGNEYIKDNNIDNLYFVAGKYGKVPKGLKEIDPYDFMKNDERRDIEALDLNFDEKAEIRDRLLNKKLYRQKL